MHTLTFDIAHLLAGSLVLVSFMLLYQDRLYALLNVYALHALVLALSVAWQAYAQDAPHLYITAAIALLFKAIVIPVALHRMISSSASTVRSIRWSASAPPCCSAWGWSRSRWW
jgi:hydrogenase-4 component E